MQNLSFIQRAGEGKNQWYWYLITILFLFIANIIGSIPASVAFLMGAGSGSDIQSMDAINPEAMGLHPALGLALLLLPFALSIVGIWIGIRFLHRRPFSSLITAKSKIDWARFFFSFLVWFGLMAGFEIIAWLVSPENYTFTFDAAKFFPTLIVVLLFIPLQTSMEELLFRGYLLQGFGLWLKRPWATILITSVAFGLMHIANPEIAEFGYGILSYYIGFGLMMAVMTVMDRGLELALGVHAANNIFGASVVTFSGSALQTPTLFTIAEYKVGLMTLVWFISSAIFLVIMTRKYHWEDWNRLWEKEEIYNWSSMDGSISEIGNSTDSEDRTS
ncbi:MAG: CPBP family intramembrane metalloprotease [Bacteroidetes bacterium]|nr:CPBP family intramembrane metalloprotease [Bacteroidota bacterium]